MSLRHALLGALADRPRTGYALLKHFGQSLAYAWPASHSQIYPELARLLSEGLIEETETGPRGSRTYALTDAGLAEVRRWLRETEPDRRVRSDAALRTFFLWLLEPGEARAHLLRERDHTRAQLDELERLAPAAAEMVEDAAAADPGQPLADARRHPWRREDVLGGAMGLVEGATVVIGRLDACILTGSALAWPAWPPRSCSSCSSSSSSCRTGAARSSPTKPKDSTKIA